MRAAILAIVATQAGATCGPLGMTELGFQTSDRSLTPTYPQGALIEMELHNQNPDFSGECTLETEQGPVRFRHEVTPNDSGACCADRLVVSDMPLGAYCEPACEIEVEENERGSIRVMPWVGG